MLAHLRSSTSMSWHSGRGRGILLPFLLMLRAVHAHEHPNEITDEMTTAPVDAILWLHIFLQASVWGVLFPIGMVLGLSHSRWHVPLQVRCVGPRKKRRSMRSAQT